MTRRHIPTGQAALEYAEPVEFSPAQAVWAEPHRARYVADPRRVRGCDGCEWWGLCLLHGAERGAP